MDKKILELAQVIGDPVDPNLPLMFELSKIAMFDTAEPGEKTWTFDGEDTIVDEVYQVASDGTLTYVKENLVGTIEVNFTDLATPLKYLNVLEVLRSLDEKKLGKIKKSITRAMDKQEAYMLLKAIMDSTTIEEITGDYTSEDIYDVIVKAFEAIEDYGDGYVLLAGSKVYSAIDLYSKKNASTFNYEVSLRDYLKSKNADLIKVFEKVKNDDGTVNLLDPKKAILVAVNSRVAEGKPLFVVRRKFDANIAKNLGVDVENQQRAIVSTSAPMNVPGTGNVLGYGLAGVESVAMGILNTRVIKKIDLTDFV